MSGAALAGIVERAVAAQRGGRDADAIALYREALASDRRQPGVLYALAGLLERNGEPDAAIALLDEALMLVPGQPKLEHARGLALCTAGRFADAIEPLRRAATVEPTARNWNNLGNALRGAGERAAAADAYGQALAHDAMHRPAQLNLAGVLVELGRYHDAEPALRRALQLQPDHYPTLISLGAVLRQLGRTAEALDVYRSAIAAAPDRIEAQLRLGTAEQDICEWRNFDPFVAKLKAHLADPVSEPLAPFIYLHLPMTPGEQRIAAMKWVAATMARNEVAPHVGARSPGERLRIGYLSSDFRRHAMAFLLTEVLERHDRSRVETFAYAYGPDDGSNERRRIVAAVDHWRDIDADSDPRALSRMRDDRLHVLVDLNGHTMFSRTALVAQRAAPVQASWLGYLGTSGVPACDFILTDRFVSPPEQAHDFTERFAYLPHCYCPSDTRRAIADVTRAECGLRDDAFVFCCFNAAYKILPDVFATWMRLLRQMDRSVLWLADVDAATQDNLRREAAAHGVAAERLVFAPRTSPAQHVGRMRCADLFVDTFPYNAGTTANDALFAGLPLLTCAGDTFASRVAGSQLHAIGLPELVTGSLADYEATALALARDRPRLSELRGRLERNRRTSPLFDMTRFTRDFEDLLGRLFDDTVGAAKGPRCA